MAKKTVQRFVERANRLYEQEPGEPCGSSRFGEYVKRWLRWVKAGLGDEVVLMVDPANVTLGTTTACD